MMMLILLDRPFPKETTDPRYILVLRRKLAFWFFIEGRRLYAYELSGIFQGVATQTRKQEGRPYRRAGNKGNYLLSKIIPMSVWLLSPPWAKWNTDRGQMAPGPETSVAQCACWFQLLQRPPMTSEVESDLGIQLNDLNYICSCVSLASICHFSQNGNTTPPSIPLNRVRMSHWRAGA